MTVGEDAEALRLAPVVDNVGQYVEIAAGGYALEEAGDFVCRTDWFYRLWLSRARAPMMLLGAKSGNLAATWSARIAAALHLEYGGSS